MSTIQVVPGFSLTNRLLIYTSTMLAPAQALSGVRNHCPSNFLFLAYNLYNQVQWYSAIKAKQLHALSLLPISFNFFFAMSYIGGVTSGNSFMAVIFTLGTAAAIILNTVAAWTSWATNQPEGFGIYQFFFFGWRTLTLNWHIFMLLWQIGDSIWALVWIAIGCNVAHAALKQAKAWGDGEILRWRYIAIPVGAAAVSLVL